AGANFPNTVHPDNAADSQLKAAHLSMARATGAATYIAQQRAILGRTDSRPLLARIAVPTAIIVGAADQVTGVDGAEEIAAGIVGAQLTIIPGAGHLVPLERPAETTTAIVEWLRA